MESSKNDLPFFKLKFYPLQELDDRRTLLNEDATKDWVAPAVPADVPPPPPNNVPEKQEPKRRRLGRGEQVREDEEDEEFERTTGVGGNEEEATIDDMIGLTSPLTPQGLTETDRVAFSIASWELNQFRSAIRAKSSTYRLVHLSSQEITFSSVKFV